MKSFLQKKEIKNPRLQLISNVTALPVKKDDDIKYLLYKQIFSPGALERNYGIYDKK